MNDYLRGFLTVVGILAVGAGGWWWWAHREAVPAPTAAAPAALEAPAPAAPDASPAAAPPQHVPIEQARVQPETPLAEAPTLDGSDGVFGEGLSAVIGSPLFEQLMVRTGLIRRIVVTIDNLPRTHLAARQLPVQPAPGTLHVESVDGKTLLAADNVERYAAYVKLAGAMEPEAIVKLYVRWYPLFQQAYRELGFPNAYFNDRLIVAIDDLLAAPDVQQPELVQPSVLYQYADPRLEALSVGRKTMIRIGVDNAVQVKDRLRAIRALLLGGAAPTG